jgi:hypothetical protein
VAVTIDHHFKENVLGDLVIYHWQLTQAKITTIIISVNYNLHSILFPGVYIYL